MATQGERVVLVSRVGARQGQGERQRLLPARDSTARPPQTRSVWPGSGGEPRDGGKAVACAWLRGERCAGAVQTQP